MVGAVSCMHESNSNPLSFWMKVLTTLAVDPQSGLRLIYAGRFISGLGIGAISAVAPAFVAECSPKEVRGRITGLFQLTVWLEYYESGLHLSVFDLDRLRCDDILLRQLCVCIPFAVLFFILFYDAVSCRRTARWEFTECMENPLCRPIDPWDNDVIWTFDRQGMQMLFLATTTIPTTNFLFLW